MELTELQTALLGLVWTAGWNGMSRSRIATLLWERDERRSRRSLSQVLYRLNNDSPVEVIEADSTDLRPSKTLGSDLQRLRLYEAREPVLGKPLERLQPLNRGPQLEQWLSAERSRLRHVAIDRNGQLLRRAEEEHEYDLAAGAAEAVLFYDPVNERALRSLVRATALASGAVTAEAAYKRHAPLFSEIIPDWKPSRETRRLLAELDSLKARQAARTTRHQIQHAVRLIGRKKELTRLREWCLGDAVSWRDMVVLGEAGIGKSRLLEELSRQLTFDACRIVQIRNWPGEERIAFNFLTEVARSEPFREAIINLPPIQRKVLARSLALEHLDVEDFELPEVEEEAASRRLYEAARCLFDAVEGRVVLLVDGLASADASSLALLSFVRRRTRHSTVRLVGSVSAEALKETGTHAAYLGKLVEQIEDRIDLSPLSPEESVELAKAAAEGDMEPSRAEAVAELGGGNPLFLIELAQPGAVEEEGENLTFPHTLDNLICRRIQGLSREARTTLKILSAQFKPVSFDSLAAICEFSRGGFLAAVDEATGARLLAYNGQEVTFRHNIIRKWTYNSMCQAERIYIHQATILHLQNKADGDVPASDMALHCHHAGRRSDAFRWAKRATAEARDRAAIPELARMLNVAAQNAPEPADRFSLTAALGRLHVGTGNIRDAVEALSAAEQLGDHASSWSSLMEGRIARVLAEAETEKVEERVALQQLQRIRLEARGKGRPRVYLQASDAEILLAQGCLDQEHAANVLSEVEVRGTPDNPYDKALYYLILTFSVSFGDPSLAGDAASKALTLVEEQGYKDLISKTLLRYIAVHSRLALLDPAAEGSLAQRLIRAEETDLHRKSLLNAWVNLAAWQLDTLRPAAAKETLDRALALAKPVRDAESLLGYESNVAEYYYESAKPAEAYRRFAAICEAGTPTRNEVYGTMQAGAGLCALELGRFGEAKERLLEVPPVETLLLRKGFDPTLVARLASRILTLEGKFDDAFELLEEWRKVMIEYHVPAYLKMTLIEASFRKRADKLKGMDGLEEAVQLSATRPQLRIFYNKLDRLLQLGRDE